MKVIIVGGGIAGLAAGTYACQSGFETTIFEMNGIPGGNSTSWRRKGYLFEGGMHWLVGSSEKVPMHKLWLEVGALRENNPVYNKDPFLTYMDENGPVCLYRNPTRLREHLMAISPKDACAINSLIKDIKAMGKLAMPVMDVKGVQMKRKQAPPLSMLFALPAALSRMNKLGKISAEEYAQRFKHPGIRILLNAVVGTSGFSASSTAFTLGGLASGDAGYPKGGSLRMAQNMADTFNSLGGDILYNQKVERVEVENNKACGVWSNGTLYKADAVIVTVDTLTAIDHLFEKPLTESWMDEMRHEIVPVNNAFICLGVRADLSHLPEGILYPLKRPFNYFGRQQNTIGFNNYAQYEGYAPTGCTALTCFLAGDTYDEWKSAKTDGTYEEKKANLASTVIDRLAEVVPETEGKVEVWDVATPLTYERYCGTWRGSWMSEMGPGCTRQEYPQKSESIDALYFAGQRVMIPGGLPCALSTGRRAVQYLCKDNGCVFQCDYVGL